jgi:hypothetical protein
LDIDEVSKKINEINKEVVGYEDLPEKYDFDEVGIFNFTKAQH